MKIITDLLAELLPNVFRFLPIYSQRQCLAVFRLWNISIRPFILTDADKVDLYGYGGIRNLFAAIQADPDYGHHIRRLNFIVQTGTGRPATRDELVTILQGCSRLPPMITATLDFISLTFVWTISQSILLLTLTVEDLLAKLL